MEDNTKTKKASEEKKEKKVDDIKSKFWAAEVYPDSAPEDWREIIQISGLVSAVSPIHDKDINANGTPKKPHYHIILCWPGPTTLNNARKFVMGKLKGPTPFELKSIRGMYNYFTHRDNPEKAQYDEKDILHINNFCLSDFVELTRREVDNTLKRIIKIINDVEITEYYGLMCFLDDNQLNDEWDVAKNNTFFLNTYITSKRNALKQEAEDMAKIEAARLKAARMAKREAEERSTENSTPFDHV